ncbi:PhaM family polyhydroxyalkanoate granule multifunctional regulatory protein [Rhodoferax sp.]|uniref:PhaM family polyhydroxyalkanoate granule multifunctional regulatory protein n=1 Tax=Rhodoferax sp. TaxID=50421 RepID=UPI002ACDFCE9|nr:PhaM family polyhydroxyalkanoate granule multifunctional regulatory protein [Rhodoferax sp.]MDZ7922166.1 PhaM family polyhydroxyalkanoate granule multifunctional regulatory protein [Rhodoferax sp.]
MSDSDTSGFGKFVPGFDFLQNLAKGASQNIPQMPNLANWVAPTLNVEELDKRIEELKNVHFWLEQNSRALGATIQALEVQKMTLATLKGMNFNLGDVTNALKLKAADSIASGVQSVTEKAASTAKTISDVASSASKGDAKGAAKAAGVPGLVDPLQLWGSLTQQFQNIAASAMKEATTKTAVDMTKNMATGLAKEAIKSAKAAGKKAAAKRPAVRKTAAKKSTNR